jgi:hypothetical protein
MVGLVVCSVAVLAYQAPPQDVVAVVSAGPLKEDQSGLIGLLDVRKREELAKKLGGKVLKLKPGFVAIEIDDPMEVELRNKKLDLAQQLVNIDFTKDVRLGDLKEPARTFLINEVRQLTNGTSWMSGVEPIEKLPLDAWGSFNLTFKQGEKMMQIGPPQWRPDRPMPTLESIPSAGAVQAARPVFSRSRSSAVMFHFGTRYSIRRRAEFMDTYARVRGDEAATALVEFQKAHRALLDQSQVKGADVGMSFNQVDPRIRKWSEAWARHGQSLKPEELESFMAGATVFSASPTIRFSIRVRTVDGVVSGASSGIDP